MTDVQRDNTMIEDSSNFHLNGASNPALDLATLPADLISHFVRYLDGICLFSLYLCGNFLLNSKLHNAVHEIFQGKDKTKEFDISNFSSRFTNLRSFDWTVSHTINSSYQIQSKFKIYKLPPSITSLKLTDVFAANIFANNNLPIAPIQPIDTSTLSNLLILHIHTNFESTLDLSTLSSNLPRSFTSFSFSHPNIVTEEFVSNLPMSLIKLSLSSSMRISISNHENWKQPFPPHLTQATIGVPISFVWTFLPQSLTSLDISSSGHIEIYKLAARPFPSQITFLSLPSCQSYDNSIIRHLPSDLTQLKSYHSIQMDSLTVGLLPKMLKCISSSSPSYIHLDALPILPRTMEVLHFNALSSMDWNLLNRVFSKQKSNQMDLSLLPPSLSQLTLMGDFVFLNTDCLPKSLKMLTFERNTVVPDLILPPGLFSLHLNCRIARISSLNLPSLPTSLTALRISISLQPTSPFDFNILPHSITYLRVEFWPSTVIDSPTQSLVSDERLKKLILFNTRLERLKSLVVTGYSALFTDEWILTLPKNIQKLDILPRLHDSLPEFVPPPISDVSTECFPQLPKYLTSLNIVTKNPVSDDSIAKLPKEITKLSINHALDSNLTTNFRTKMPPNLTSLIVPKSTFGFDPSFTSKESGKFDAHSPSSNPLLRKLD